MRPEPFIFVLIGGLLAGCGTEVSLATHSWYDLQGSKAPEKTSMVVCHGHGCTYQKQAKFSAAEISKMQSILAAGAASPEAERAAIGRMVQWNERRVAPLVGSAGDVPGMDLVNSGKPGQMDCIDEATNTTSLLLVAERNGLLRHHTVKHPVVRGILIDGRIPHATAVVRDKSDGIDWAVDSWRLANAQPPDIMTLKHWLKTRSSQTARETGRG